jgi:hypothetical protein
MNIKMIAQICHEANRAYCQSIGDDTQPHWEEAPHWQTESAINGVKFVLSFGHDPAAQHKNWAEEKYRAGWKYGPVKDVDKKEHPCLVEYKELPKEQIVKDKIFGSIVSALALAL